MGEYLVFRLYGPFASWGDIPGSEYRPSYAHPSKSSIIGLLAAALGIRRDEEELQKALSESFDFAVRVDAAGSLLRDYHTIQTPPKKQGVVNRTRRRELSVEDLYTVLSTRDYYCDAAYTVAIKLRDGARHSVNQLADALRKPLFTLYLGRKSCPLALPLQPKIIDTPTLKDALDSMPFCSDDLAEISRQGDYVGIYWEDSENAGYEARHVTYRRDVPTSRNAKRWQFGVRRENYTSIRRGTQR